MDSALYETFTKMMEDYCSSFKNKPQKPHQILQFCKNSNDANYDSFKYEEIVKLFNIWLKNNSNSNGDTMMTEGINIIFKKNENENENNTEMDCDVDEEKDRNDLSDNQWISFWKEYEIQYGYPPKQSLHFWNFVKDEKLISVKYCYAKNAFQTISKSKSKSIAIQESQSIEGQFESTTNSNNNNSNNNNNLKSNEIKSKITLNLKITSKTSSERLKEIYDNFKNLYITFKKTQNNHPKNAVMLFRFINEETDYKVRYTDINKIYDIAIEENWFDTKNNEKENESNHNNNNNNNVLSEMNEEMFEKILSNYQKFYDNPPTDAVQIMKFAKDEMNQIYKYKDARIAFEKWKRSKQ